MHVERCAHLWYGIIIHAGPDHPCIPNAAPTSWQRVFWIRLLTVWVSARSLLTCWPLVYSGSCSTCSTGTPLEPHGPRLCALHDYCRRMVLFPLCFFPNLSLWFSENFFMGGSQFMRMNLYDTAPCPINNESWLLSQRFMVKGYNISVMIMMLRDWENTHKSYLLCSEIFNQLIKADSDTDEYWWSRDTNWAVW